MANYLFFNGRIVDGTGDASFLADILTHDDHIVRVGRNLSAPGAIDSPATYESPELDPLGIQSVYRNGQPATIE